MPASIHGSGRQLVLRSSSTTTSPSANMRTFFTSDLHLQSTESPGIIDWAHRPFKSVQKMEEALIRGINERCKPDDLLIHVGDFMNYGKNKGKESGRVKPQFFIDKINCQVIFLEGNHDPNNHVRCIGRTLTTKVGRYIVSVSHYPSWDDRFETVETPVYFYAGMKECPVHIHLCGHCHDKWKYSWGGYHKGDPDIQYLNINVGVDAWKYRPVSEAELDVFIEKVLAKKI